MLSPRTPVPAFPIRVTVHHADPIVALGLRTVLAAQTDMHLMDEDLPQSEMPPGPDVLVADLSQGLLIASAGLTPDRRAARRTGVPPRRVLVIAATSREHDVRSAVDAGVAGYLDLACDAEELVAGVRQLAGGARYFCPRAAQRVAESLLRDRLTARELVVLRLVAGGLSNKHIASRLGVSTGTVKTHVKSVLAKLEASSRTHAARIALERGLVEAPASTPPSDRRGRLGDPSMQATGAAWSVDRMAGAPPSTSAEGSRPGAGTSARG